MRSTHVTQATLPELSREVGERQGRPVSGVSQGDGRHQDDAGDPAGRVEEYRIVLYRHHCEALIAGVVPEDVQAAARDCLTALHETPAESVRRWRRR
jgi:hypothetical protein